jgi:diadenosine tetraphosphate (Ap4A) HIT family hydrolase
MTQADCPLCISTGGELVFQGAQFRVIRADEPGFPAFYRVVWRHHVAEMSDLSPAERSLCLAAVNTVELALRQHLQPHKINLAALGNMVPHLHWHVVARFSWDSHFPAPVWAPAVREVDALAVAEVVARRAAMEQDMQRELSALVLVE